MDRNDMSSYGKFIFNLPKDQYVKERRNLFSLINGELFYPLREWPSDYKLMFWKKPLTDTETFKMFLFLSGNGCPPEVMQKWLLSGNYYSDVQKRNRRLYQILYLQETISSGSKDNIWFYFDIHMKLNVFLNGNPRTI